MATAKRQALIIIPSGGPLPLSEPANSPPIEVGFFLVELAQILLRFDATHDFVFATPDGSVPRMDTNGLALPYFAREELVAMMQKARQLQAAPDFDPENYRNAFPNLLKARIEEFSVLDRFLSRIGITAPLPATDAEAASIYAEVAAHLETLAPKTYLSARQVVERHRNPDDAFDIGAFDFIHAPGGHAPMVSFLDDPWLGEIFHVARENGVLLSLICHAPLILTSTQYRIDSDGNSIRLEHNPFAGVTVSTVPKAAERAAEDYGYLKIPGQQTRLTYYIDEALEAAGIHNLHKPNPASVEVYYEPAVNMASTNGPQGIDAPADKVEELGVQSRSEVIWIA